MLINMEAKHQETFQMYVDANEARIDAEAKLAKAVAALDKLNVGDGWAAQIARTTLAELKRIR